MEIITLTSGSKGNAVYIASKSAEILVDAGLSAREIEKRLRVMGKSPENLSAILVTHEHIDHIRGVGPLSRRYKIPVYVTERTFQAAEKTVGRPAGITCVDADTPFEIEDLWFSPFQISHDAVEPLGFAITDGEIKAGIATDLGVVTHLVRENLRGVNVAIVEANHDTDMLLDGPYPWDLKQRIKGREGHLSNVSSAKLVETIFHADLRKIVLAHLSEVNNRPAKARECLLERIGRRIDAERVVVARPDRPVRVL
ncbi:MAG: MBL fold metallo-hydrolase [Nitrospiraceae bacterium]|nr:MBL fold metallo-hydrolase [Nitrospiraceae bacterium]